ncbi:MAG: hypothetical protein HY738_06330, partial [Bacteroidia bacterium]|nr:hypothetical protein [Bacteroidia bacterium]
MKQKLPLGISDYKKIINGNFYLLFVFLFLLINGGKGQFYNGIQMDFGKNRVQHNRFFWQYFRFNRFDVYFYVGGSEIAKDAGLIAAEKLKKIEGFFEYNLERRLIFVVYNKLTDFRQSNIGLISGNDQYNIGGMTKIIDNKVFIYNEGNRQKLEEQVAAAVAEVVLNEMLYGKNFRQRVTNSTLLSLPDWYYKGLISYAANHWSIEIENYVKDGILNRRYEKFNRLTGTDAVYAGHSIWNFIANTYGKSVIPNI